MTGATFRHAFRIGSDHPCLPGHFPGRPLVPGVVLLEEVACALRAWRGQHLGRVVEAKFVAPLVPEREASVTLQAEAAGTQVRFAIHAGAELIARGRLEGVP